MQADGLRHSYFAFLNFLTCPCCISHLLRFCRAAASGCCGEGLGNQDNYELPVAHLGTVACIHTVNGKGLSILCSSGLCGFSSLLLDQKPVLYCAACVSPQCYRVLELNPRGLGRCSVPSQPSAPEWLESAYCRRRTEERASMTCCS